MAADATATQWHIHKFGGTSLASPKCFQRVKSIICNVQETSSKRVAVVCSAMGGKPKTTDLLLQTVRLAAQNQPEEYQKIIDMMRLKHVDAAEAMLPPKEAEQLVKVIDNDLREIRDILRAVSLMRFEFDAILELVSGYGELWSTQMMTALLQSYGLKFTFLDARRVLRIEEIITGTAVMWEESGAYLEEFLAGIPSDHSLVITGYIASTKDGGATTLKRDGSDFSASIFGRLLNATEISIWTDVDGVLTADPRKVPEATVLNELSYNEAIALAYFGAKVVHPKTMLPAIDSKIPIFIRNTFNELGNGTRIFEPSDLTMKRKSVVAGFSTVENVSLITVEGTGMIGVTGIVQQIFNTLQTQKLSIKLVTQSSSEHSISFATSREDAAVAKTMLDERFNREIARGHINAVTILEDCAILAAVGDGMAHTPGVSGRLFNALGNAHVNILAIAQGCDESNISAVVRTCDTERALRAIHSSFLLSDITISVGIIMGGSGDGNQDEEWAPESIIGLELARVLLNRRNWLQTRYKSDIRVRAITTTTHMKLVDDLLDTLSPNLELNEEADFERFCDHVRTDRLPHSLIVDCSEDPAIAALHAGWLSRGVHVVTSNINGLSGTLDAYDEIMHNRRLSKTFYGCDVCIGGGIPVLSVLKPILDGGDEVHVVEGIFSATLSYIMGRLSPSFKRKTSGEEAAANPVLFSQALREAQDMGLVNNNPLDDLLGADSRAKMIVVARALGLAMTEGHIECMPAIPTPAPAAGDGGEIDWTLLDQPMADKVAAARAKDCVLRYVGRLDGQGSAVIELKEVPLASTIGQVEAGNVCSLFWTRRYQEQPLMVEGPLGTPEATAAGLLGDILQLVAALGGRDIGPHHLKRTPSMNKLERSEPPSSLVGRPQSPRRQEGDLAA